MAVKVKITVAQRREIAAQVIMDIVKGSLDYDAKRAILDQYRFPEYDSIPMREAVGREMAAQLGLSEMEFTSTEVAGIVEPPVKAAEPSGSAVGGGKK